MGLEAIQKTIELCLATGYVRNDRPVSLCIIAPPALGKSEVITNYQNYPGALHFTYTSLYQLLSDYLGDFEAGRYHHLLIPDLAQVVFKPKDIASNELTGLNSLIEEGIGTVATRTTRFTPSNPLRVGVITAITPQDYDKLEARAPAGFLSRFLWTAYSYSKETLERIHQVMGQGLNPATPYIYALPEGPAFIRDDFDYLRRIGESEIARKARQPGDTKGLRTFRTLCQLSRAYTLLSKRQVIEREDILEVANLTYLLGTKVNAGKEL